MRRTFLSVKVLAFCLRVISLRRGWRQVPGLSEAGDCFVGVDVRGVKDMPPDGRRGQGARLGSRVKRMLGLDGEGGQRRRDEGRQKQAGLANRRRGAMSTGRNWASRRPRQGHGDARARRTGAKLSWGRRGSEGQSEEDRGRAPE